MNKKTTLTLLLGLIFGFGSVLVSATYALDQAHPHGSAANEQVPAGFHEFEMFGEKSIYLSHYPMFGSIHAYQVILEVGLRAEGKNPQEAYLKHKQAHPNARYSVSPETADGADHYWVLPEVIRPGKSFRANIHLQNNDKHSPRDYLVRNATVEIKKVIHFRLFQPDDRTPEALTYLLFGNESEAFLAHYIGNHPDFDQILSVTIEPKELLGKGKDPARVVIIPGRKNDKASRLTNQGETVTGQIQGSQDKLQIKVRGQMHIEKDLELQS